MSTHKLMFKFKDINIFFNAMVNKMLIDLKRSDCKQTVEPVDPPLLKRKMFPYKVVEKFGKLSLLSCVLPAQVHKDVSKSQ